MIFESVEVEDRVGETVENIAMLAAMPQNAVVNKLIIDGLRYKYGINSIFKSRNFGEKGD